MEAKIEIKKCDICKKDATSLCSTCKHYFCDSCFKKAHSAEKTKSHKKEKIDYYVPMNERGLHNEICNMNGCVDEKSM